MRKRSGYRNIDGKRVWSTTVTHVYQERHDDNGPDVTLPPGTFVIAYGDSPSLSMVRVVRPCGSGLTAPYIRHDRHLRRYDDLPITHPEDFTPLAAWGRDVALVSGGDAVIAMTGEPETATYPEDGARRYWQGQDEINRMIVDPRIGDYVRGLLVSRKRGAAATPN
jgi:hypothetical protein